MKRHLRLMVVQCLLFSMLIGCASIQGDWEKAKRSDTVYAYQEFLGDHPGSEYDGQARKRIEEIAWAHASKQGNAYSYREFVRKHPKSPYAKEAEEKITDLEWADAKRRDSKESYANFLSKYSSNLHAGEARKRIREMKFKAVMKAESVAAIEDFLNIYPQGDDAEALRRELPAVRAWEPRKRLAEQVIRLCPKDTLTVKNLLNGTTRTQPSNPKDDLAEIRSLLEHGVDPNAVRIAGWAPRRVKQGFVFTRGGLVPSTEIQMGDPGHPVPPDKIGMTLLEYCRANGLTEAFDLLRSHGAK